VLITEVAAALVAIGPANQGIASVTKHAFAAIFHVAAIMAKVIA
jgi:hypothetical protein